MWHEAYLIKQALSWDEVNRAVVGPGGISETFSSPPIMLYEKLTGKRFGTGGSEGALLAFLDPGVFTHRILMKSKYPEWYKEEE